MKLAKALLIIFPAVNALTKHDGRKDFTEELENGHYDDQLLKGITKFHSKEYQDKKAAYLRSKEYQEKKAKYLRGNPGGDEINGQSVSNPGNHDHTGCYVPTKYQNSGCCSKSSCQNFGCMVNKGTVDSHTPCDPDGTKTGTQSFVFCTENGCNDSDDCKTCWCGKLDDDHKIKVKSDLSNGILYYAFTTEWSSNQGCENCGGVGDIAAEKVKLLRGDCLPLSDGKAHNGMRCSGDSYCKSERCSNEFTCEDKLDNGSECREDNDCNSGRCDDHFHCADKIGKGGWCEEDNDCKSNNCVRDQIGSRCMALKNIV